MTGTVLEEKPVEVTEEEVRTVIRSFLGEQQQIPPMYSALKVDGKKLYELAREGKTVERKPRAVQFYEIEIKKIELPYVRFSVTCSKGTYIRTLCHDIGQKLGCGGCMEELLRTRSGNFVWEDSMTLAQVEEAVRNGTIGDRVISIGQALKDYPEIFVHGKATAFWKMEMRLLRDLSEESTKKAGCVCVTARVDSREFTSGMR